MQASKLHSLPAIIPLSYFVFLVVTITTPLGLAAAAAATIEHEHPTSYKEFINASCQVTRYPNLCFKTLSPYAAAIRTNPTDLANVALNVSLEKAESTSNLVLELSKGSTDLSPREVEAIRDCLEDMGDSVDDLQKSLLAMKDLDGPDFQEKMGNVMTWVSAAMTDEDTCMDGFDEQVVAAAAAKDGAKNIKSKIRSNIVRLAELISNALALISHISST